MKIEDFIVSFILFKKNIELVCCYISDSLFNLAHEKWIKLHFRLFDDGLLIENKTKQS